MMQYLIILLDDTSTSFCHYHVPVREPRLMPIDTLRQAIRFAMKQNLAIQFVYPNQELPQEYKDVIDTIDHYNIKAVADDADALVVSNWDFSAVTNSTPLVLRTTKDELFHRYDELRRVLWDVPHLNVIITDLETFTEADFETYRLLLKSLSKTVAQLYVEGRSPQINILTDRMLLTAMNNCGAGNTTITLAPNGKFYTCPAFYYDNEADHIGDLQHGIDIPNQQLYRLSHAPICSHCDAWQCRRCIWLNRKTTREVNIPSHEQCVVAHLERNASRQLLLNVRCYGDFMPEVEIKEIDYTDPFENINEWQ